MLQAQTYVYDKNVLAVLRIHIFLVAAYVLNLPCFAYPVIQVVSCLALPCRAEPSLSYGVGFIVAACLPHLPCLALPRLALPTL